MFTSSVSPTFNAMYYQSGSGQILFFTGNNTTLNNRLNNSSSAGQYAITSVIRVPNGDFVLGGDTA